MIQLNLERKTSRARIRVDKIYYQTHYFINSKTYQREGGREGQRKSCQNCYIFFARRAVFAWNHNLALEQEKKV